MASEVVVIDRNARLPTRRRTATEPVDARLLRTIATILPADHPPISALDGETQLEARADATKLAIAADLDCWRYWCAKHQRDPFPADPEHIVLYLRQLEKDGRKPATLARRIASLAAVHQIVGIKTDQLPTNAAMVRNALKGMRRRKGVVQKQAAPLRFGGALATVKGFTVSALLGACVGDVQGLRDAALLSVGFDGGLRVSELVAVSAADLEPDADGQHGLADELTDPRGDPFGRHARQSLVERGFGGLVDPERSLALFKVTDPLRSAQTVWAGWTWGATSG